MKLWDVEKGVEKQEITGHMEIIQSVAWNYNGTLVATTCRDKKLRVFDVRSNKVVQVRPDINTDGLLCFRFGTHIICVTY